jgi:hypothetical protein
MAHVKKQIRDTIKTTLTGLATTGANAFDSRVYDLQASELPALTIYPGSESVEYLTLNRGSRSKEHTFEIGIDAVATGTSGLADTLDLIEKEVVVALSADPTIGGLARDCFFVSSENIISGEGDKPSGIRRMVYQAVFVTLETDPETAL